MRERAGDWVPAVTHVSELRNNELLGSLTDQELSRIRPICSEFAVIENGLLFGEGREASYLYLVMEGRIALLKAIRFPHARRPRRTTVTICGPGDAVGWSALVEPYKYTLSAMAWETSRLIRIDAKNLRKSLEMYPEMGYKVVRSLSALMSRRLRQITEAIINDPTVSLAGLDLSDI